MKKIAINAHWGVALLFFSLACYTVWSYGLTAPNLVLSNWQPYWQFQLFMWETLFNNRTLLAQSYGLLLSLVVVGYLALFAGARKTTPNSFWQKEAVPRSLTQLLFPWFLCISPLLVASTALSYDVFNYAFNAKMVVEYQADPHTRVALEFAHSDDWVRFMHNTHTAAPYGYGWTAVSLIPYWASGGSFVLSWFFLRILSLNSVILLLYSLVWVAGLLRYQLRFWQLAALLFNPLFLIEIIGNSHNDLWMIWPAVVSLGLLLSIWNATHTSQQKMSIGSLIWRVVASALLLLFSISIKFATVILIPVWIFIVVALILLKFQAGKTNQSILEYGELVTQTLPFLLSLALFIPLLHPRSRWFLPWYLSWSLSLLPIVFAQAEKTITAVKGTSISKKFVSYVQRSASVWSEWLVVLSLTALFRYLPFLATGEYTETGNAQQFAIVWLPALFLVLILRYTSYRKYSGTTTR